MTVLSEAADGSHPAMRNVYFDMATNVVPQSPDASAEFVTARIRQIGISRVVYGSDGPPNLPAAESWRAHHEKLELTPGEFEQIRNNVAPFLK